MAVTKIWPVHGSLRDLLIYAANPEKTLAPTEIGDHGLDAVLDYAANPDKTLMAGPGGEKLLFVSGVNCLPEIAGEQMRLTKQRYGKTGGTVAFHAYQSFRPGEVMPEQCHEIGVALARELWGERFEVLVTTHLNTDCCHNHFVINSVSFADGKRYNDCKATYRAFRDASDRLCRERGLSVLENPGTAHTPRKLYLDEKAGLPTLYNALREDIDRAIGRSWTAADCWQNLRRMGYRVNIDPKRKYAAIRMPGSSRPVRLKTLGENYTEEAIKERVARHQRTAHPKPAPEQLARRRAVWNTICRQSGLYRLYLHYCYLLGIIRKVPGYRPPHPALRADLRRADAITAQMRLIERYHLNDMDAVQAFIGQKQGEMQALTAKRTGCYNRLRRCDEEAEREAVRKERDDLTEQIAALRKEVKIAAAIPESCRIMEKNIGLLEERERERASVGQRNNLPPL